MSVTGQSRSLYQRLLDAGYPEDEMFHHESDLYVYATPLTWRVIQEWVRDNGISFSVLDCSLFFSTFKDQITGRRMYDIAFQYTPWWEEKSRGNRYG